MVCCVLALLVCRSWMGAHVHSAAELQWVYGCKGRRLPQALRAWVCGVRALHVRLHLLLHSVFSRQGSSSSSHCCPSHVSCRSITQHMLLCTCTFHTVQTPCLLRHQAPSTSQSFSNICAAPAAACLLCTRNSHHRTQPRTASRSHAPAALAHNKQNLLCTFIIPTAHTPLFSHHTKHKVITLPHVRCPATAHVCCARQASTTGRPHAPTALACHRQAPGPSNPAARCQQQLSTAESLICLQLEDC